MSSYLTEYIVPTLIQCIVPAIAIVYTMMENHKLNKLNRVIPFINSDFDRYINDLRLIYTELNSYYRQYNNASDVAMLFNKIKDDRVTIYQTIKSIYMSLEKIKQNAKKSYYIYNEKIKTIENYLENINNCHDTSKYRDYFLNYLKYIIDYCATIPVSIYYEVNEIDIKEDNINSIYNKIEEIQNELNEKLGE